VDIKHINVLLFWANLDAPKHSQQLTTITTTTAALAAATTKRRRPTSEMGTIQKHATSSLSCIYDGTF